MTKKYKEELQDSHVVYIDPVDCGSTVGYRVKLSGSTTMSVQAEVELSDYSRTINWSFYGPNSLTKIDIAIEALTRFRNSYEQASKKLTKKGKNERTN